MKPGASYQLLLALYLIHRLSLQLLLGAQRGHAVGFQALGLLLRAPPLLLQLQGPLDLVRELCGAEAGAAQGSAGRQGAPTPRAGRLGSRVGRSQGAGTFHPLPGSTAARTRRHEARPLRN